MHERSRQSLLVIALAGALALAGCTTTPTAPPKLDLPPATQNDPDLERWWTAFNDTTLTALIEEALANNLDLKLALAKIELAQAQLLLAQSDQDPTVDLTVNAAKTRSTQIGANPLPPGFSAYTTDYLLGLKASYEVDLWGKYRTATAAAQNDLLASEYARQTVRTEVAAQVAQTYFSLLAADAELIVLYDTLKTRDETVELQRDRYQAGVIGDYDFVQAEAERAAVASDIALAQRIDAQLESALTVLLGRSPREVFDPKLPRDVESVRLLGVPTIPAGLPSNLLERRPDIRSAEKQLAAANQRIDVARADYFPSLSLTGAYGTEAGILKNLFTGPSLAWGIIGALTQPLLGLKGIEANVLAKTANRDASVVNYEQTVLAAFKDTHDALVASETTRNGLAAQTVRKNKLAQALELSNLRYTSGYSPYLEVLDTQRLLLQAQTLQILAARDVRLATVDLAKALGGGWQYKTAVAEE